MLPLDPSAPESHAELALLDSAHSGDARVLKQGDSFALCGSGGELAGGLFDRDTRYLAQLKLLIQGLAPDVLATTVDGLGQELKVEACNPRLRDEAGHVIGRGTLHLSRSLWLGEGQLLSTQTLVNHGREPVELSCRWEFASDFADVFEVRGMRRQRRGVGLEPEIGADTVLLGYLGLDDLPRRVRLRFDPQPARLTKESASFRIRLAPGRAVRFGLGVDCLAGQEQPKSQARNSGRIQTAFAPELRIRTPDPAFDGWMRRSLADLRMLTTLTPHGLYPYAGVPWYSTPFGRDGILTALQCLWFAPELGRGVLRYLAATQAQDWDAVRDAAPGKILHEIRRGEMAALHEVPYGQYYGSVDATPLFVVLAGALYRQTGELELIRELWPALEAALGWIDGPGDVDRDGFVEYAGESATGLVNQGWKDSAEAIFDAQGELARGPIALCEVQGYVYAARLAAAELAAALGKTDRAAELRIQAETLKQRFEAAFWCQELGSYGIALDGNKQLCQVLSSNPGHCLYTGIASPERARQLSRTLMGHKLNSGWGILTLAYGSPRFNPISYHNGSIWPHDNALIAAGFARYGLKQSALTLLEGYADAIQGFAGARLPELFCGFGRRRDEAPVPYPSACSPQAWAAGAGLMMLQACLGLEVGPERIVLRQPALPAAWRHFSLEGLPIKDAQAGFSLVRKGPELELADVFGPVEVMLEPQSACPAP